MVKILTGYFAKASQYEKAGYEPISIALWPPKGFTGRTCPSLAPSKKLLTDYKNKIVDQNGYTKEFKKNLSPEKLRQSLEKLSNETSADKKGIVLCCFEKPSDFCHRHIIENIGNTELGLDISEFQL